MRQAKTPKTEKYLFYEFVMVVKRASPGGFGDNLRSEYRLIRLHASTIRDLKRLKSETGQASLNNLISNMIRLTDSYRTGLKEAGWESS